MRFSLSVAPQSRGSLQHKATFVHSMNMDMSTSSSRTSGLNIVDILFESQHVFAISYIEVLRFPIVSFYKGYEKSDRKTKRLYLQ